MLVPPVHVRLMPSPLSALTSETLRAADAILVDALKVCPGMWVKTLTFADTSWSSLRLTKLTVFGLTVCWRVRGIVGSPAVVPQPSLLTEIVYGPIGTEFQTT